MYTTVNPSFTIKKWGVRGYTLHGLVIMMTSFCIVVAMCDLVHDVKAMS